MNSLHGKGVSATQAVTEEMNRRFIGLRQTGKRDSKHHELSLA
jgi:hypothetical protein